MTDTDRGPVQVGYDTVYADPLLCRALGHRLGERTPPDLNFRM